MATLKLAVHPGIVDRLPHQLTGKHRNEQSKRLIEDDLHAGYQIPAILTGIILFGLISMVLSVVAIVLLGAQ